ncbi:MAG: hypothetical protein ACFFCW_17130 [Candidatus Hodarchaeota archaeon]
MRNKTSILLILFVFIFSVSIYAQEKEEQTVQKIKLPKLYLEQKLDRAVVNVTAYVIGGIAFAKSLEKTPEDYGKFIGDMFAPSWEGIKGKGITRFIEGMSRNFQSDVNCQWEILSESDKSVKVKMNRFGDAIVKASAEMGVTTEEYDRCLGKVMEAIANYLGFDFKQELKGDWIVFTVSEK